MTFFEILDKEADNSSRITFYYEGSFWKAYEKSAFLVCEHFEKFQTSKKSVKYLNGAEIISIGIPRVTLERVFAQCEKEVVEEKRIVFKTDYSVDEDVFMAWKNAAALKGKKHIVDDNVITEKLKRFDLATASPMDCMMLIMELKKMLANGDIHNT